MKNEAKLGIGVVILAGLAGLVYVQQKKDASVGSATATAADLPSLSVSDDLDKLEITNGDKPTVELDRVAAAGDAGTDEWNVAKPVASPGKSTEVKALLDNLKELKVKDVISTVGATPEQLTDYQLDATKGVHVVGYKGGDKKVDITFGKQGGRGELVSIGGNPGIYAVSGYVGYQYTREPKDWRQNEIFKFDDANATAFTIENKNGLYSFTKNGDAWAGSLKGQPIKDFDPEKAKSAIGAFKNLNADNFGDGKTAADTGLDAPESTVTINMKDNTAKYVVHVGKIAQGTSHYAQRDGNPTIYTISSWAGDWALADPVKFTKTAADAGAAPAGSAGAPGKPGMPGMAMPGRPIPPGATMPPGHPAVPPAH